MPSQGHKDQHWVARSYLNAWCDPDCPIYYVPYVNVFRRDGAALGRRAPKNLFSENNLYTIRDEDGARDLHLEHGLSTIEDEFARLRPKIERREVLSGEEFAWLLAFVAATHVRTPRMREHHRKQYGHILKVMDDAQGAIDQMTAEEKQRFAMSQPEAGEGPKMTHEQVKQIAAEPLQEIMWPMLEAELSAFAAVNIKFGILSHDDDLGFVTSDSPCVWYDPEAALMPPIYRDVGVGSPTVEITLPITPNSAVILSHQDHLTGYIPISESMVHVLNRRTIFHCDEEFVCSRPKTHPYWFFGMNRGIIAPEPNEQAPPV